MIKRVEDPGQLAACAALIRRCFSTVAEEFGLTAENCPTNGAFITEERLRGDFDRGCIMAVLYVREEPAGFIQLTDCGGGIFSMEKLGVIPPHRHRGCGLRLLEWANRTVCELGGHRIRIGIIEENHRLRLWYAAGGYDHVGVRTVDGLPFTVGYMEKSVVL